MKPLSHYIAALFFLAFLTSVSLQDDGTEKWPVADEDGYYKAYKVWTELIFVLAHRRSL